MRVDVSIIYSMKLTSKLSKGSIRFKCYHCGKSLHFDECYYIPIDNGGSFWLNENDMLCKECSEKVS